MDVEQAIAELYGLPSDEFVGRRDELAKQLREEDDRDAAAVVGKLRKPTVAAWAVNQLSRRQPEDLDALLELADKVEKAQRRAVSGRRAPLRETVRELRSAISSLTGAASSYLQDVGSQPATHRDAIAATIQAATVDEEVRDALREGRLERTAEAPGFGTLAGLSVTPDAAEAPAEDEAPPEDPHAEKRAELESQANSLRSRVRDLERAAEKSAKRAEQAEERADRLRRQADEAQGAATEARRNTGELGGERDAARAELNDVEEELSRLG
ncbi:MAG: hypothetical protein ACRDUY_04720 [Nitriliruptorales bacterium]